MLTLPARPATRVVDRAAAVSPAVASSPFNARRSSSWLRRVER